MNGLGSGITIALLAIVGIVLLLVAIIWSMKRHRSPTLQVECNDSIEELVPSLAGLTLSGAMEGNAVEVYENGAFFDVLIDEISAARRSVHFESFLWKEGMLGQRIADAMSARARTGVAVRILVDATGSKGMGKSVERQLKQSGCKLVKFHKWHIRNIGVMNERDHRKLVVLDGRVALLGGHCIVDTWLGNAEDKEHYADVSVRLRGPIVHSVQAAFSENWVGHTGELFMGEDVFPPLERLGTVTIHAAYVKPEGSAPAVQILHHAAICCAKKGSGSRTRISFLNPRPSRHSATPSPAESTCGC